MTELIEIFLRKKLRISYERFRIMDILVRILQFSTYGKVTIRTYGNIVRSQEDLKIF